MTSAPLPLRMPAETDPHERTLMGWPCRRELWGPQLAAAGPTTPPWPTRSPGSSP